MLLNVKTPRPSLKSKYDPKDIRAQNGNCDEEHQPYDSTIELRRNVILHSDLSLPRLFDGREHTYHGHNLILNLWCKRDELEEAGEVKLLRPGQQGGRQEAGCARYRGDEEAN